MRNRFKTNRYSVAFKTSGSNTYTIIDNPSLAFVADPFLFKHNGQLYIFAEIYDYIEKKGKLGYTKFDTKSNSFGKWTIVISEDWHLSYPHIFTKENDIFIVPESNENHSIYMYKAISFPDKWERVTTLYEGSEKFVDTTLFSVDNQQYGFTYCIESGQNAKKGELRLFTIINGSSDIKNSMLVTDDITCARSAGNIIKSGSKLVRVSQDCKLRYGHGLCFSEFTLNNYNGILNYSENVIKRIYPEDIKLNKKMKLLQVHTYNQLGDFEVIDIGYREHNLLLFLARIVALFH